MSNETHAHTATLYERLGGAAGIANLIDRFYDKVIHDPELGPFFAGKPIEPLVAMQKEFFSAALEGPQTYSGMALSQAHVGRGIKAAHFTRWVNLLLETLKEIGIDSHDLDAVVSRISTYSDDILSPGAFAG